MAGSNHVATGTETATHRSPARGARTDHRPRVSDHDIDRSTGSTGTRHAIVERDRCAPSEAPHRDSAGRHRGTRYWRSGFIARIVEWNGEIALISCAPTFKGALAMDQERDPRRDEIGGEIERPLAVVAGWGLKAPV